MKRRTSLQLALCLATAAFAASSEAAPHQTCVPHSFGVPTRPGPPDWWDLPSSGGDPALDDPRWNQASGESFQLGGAEAPLHTRALWATVGGKDYLYLSFISDLAPVPPSTQASTLGRDIFLGFRRAHPDTKNPSDPSDDEYGYIFQFHLGSGGAANAEALNYCGKYEGGTHHECPDASSWWRMFLDSNGVAKCGDTGHTGEQYVQFNGADVNTPPITWMANSVHFWKLGGTGPLQNRWAVQARIQLADANHPLSEGIEKGSTFWYEATEALGTPYASIGKFPAPNPTQSGVTTSICPNFASIQDFLVHEELGSVPTPGAPDPCTNCSPDHFANLLTFTGSPPASCDAGLKIESKNIGSLYNPTSPPPGFNIDTSSPPTEFSAPLANRLIAQVHNTTGAAIDVPLMARFRLANWGASGLTDGGTFDAIPGTENGVCAAAGASAPGCAGSFSIPAGGQKAITFDWTLSDSDKCSYQIPGFACTPCTCDKDNGCDPKAPSGTQGTQAPGQPCVKKHFPHECMYVELTAPNGGVTFVQQSAYHNMNFGEMSTVAREALIDARKLPTIAGQAYQDIYLLVMPRNMPASVPPTTTTVALVQNAAISDARRIAQPYIDDLNRQVQVILRSSEVPSISIQFPEGDERIQPILRARSVMSKTDLARVDALLGVAFNQSQSNQPSAAQVRNAVSQLGPEVAAEIVPTLEIYPFYLPGGRGKAYQPMTAFTVFLSHEDTLSGVRYQIDGATKVGENVYHLRIPVGNARKIQVRAQALTSNEAALPPGNPSWPCAGGCVACGGLNRNCGLVATIANTTPGLVAGVFVIRRRRKRKPAKAA